MLVVLFRSMKLLDSVAPLPFLTYIEYVIPLALPAPLIVSVTVTAAVVVTSSFVPCNKPLGAIILLGVTVTFVLLHAA